MTALKRFIPILIAFIILISLVALFKRVRRYDSSFGESREGPAIMADISVRLENTLLVSREYGRPRWMMHADRIELHRSSGDDLERFRAADFKGIRNGSFFRDGKREFTFSAEQATYDFAARRFEIDGNLNLKSYKGDSLAADQCYWSEHDDFIRFPQGGRGVFHDGKITSPSMLYSPKRGRIECPKGAEAVFNGYPLRASALYWDTNSNRVDCPGLVSGERKNLTFRAMNMTFDTKTREMTANSCSAQLRIEEGY